MNQTKTAVILAIIILIVLGAVLYALRDNFKGEKKETKPTAEA